MVRVLLLLISCIPLLADAQFDQCVDSNRINPYYQCNNPEFNPVCGCNNVTYRNSCEMTNIGGVNFTSQNQNGVCQNDFYFYFTWPNPVRNSMNFNMQFAEGQSGPVTLQIYNVYGNPVLTRLITNITEFNQPTRSFDLTGLESGVYVLLVRSGGISKVSKFVKHNF